MLNELLCAVNTQGNVERKVSGSCVDVDVDCRTGSLHLGPCIRALCAPHIGIVSFRHLQRHSAPTGARELY
jgi:hypothetical protein